MTATRTPVMPRKPMPRQGFRTILEEALEDVALLMAQKHDEIDHLYSVRNILSQVWEGTQPDETPEFTLATRVVKAS